MFVIYCYNLMCEFVQGEEEDDAVTISFSQGSQEDLNPRPGRVDSTLVRSKQSKQLAKDDARLKVNGKRTLSPQPSFSSGAAGGKDTGQNDEYAEDSSDEEDLRNTIGNIPVEWYDNYPHIGYDVGGRRVLKPVREDQLDYFLKRMDDPTFW